jgi:hypothetical protein
MTINGTELLYEEYQMITSENQETALKAEIN